MMAAPQTQPLCCNPQDTHIEVNLCKKKMDSPKNPGKQIP